VSGRTEQLGRQLRRLRSNAADHDAKGCALALRRATHLARDLALEHAEADEPPAALAELATQGMIDAVLAERVGARIERAEEDDQETTIDSALDDGRDLDRFLRSIEHGALMPELPFLALTPTEMPHASSRAAVTISGRHIVVAERGHEGLVFVDDRPIGTPFELMAAPTSKPQVVHDPVGVTRIVWEPENLTIELAADFASASRA